MSGMLFSKSGTRAEGKSSRGQTPGTQKPPKRLFTILTSHGWVPSGSHRRGCSAPLGRKTCRLANSAPESSRQWNTVVALRHLYMPILFCPVHFLKQDGSRNCRTWASSASLCSPACFLAGNMQHHARGKKKIWCLHSGNSIVTGKAASPHSPHPVWEEEELAVFMPESHTVLIWLGQISSPGGSL